MSFLQQGFRTEIRDYAVRKSLDDIAAVVTNWQSREHRADGRHEHVTAETLRVYQTARIEGYLEAVSDLFVGGRSFLGWRQDELADVLADLGSLSLDPQLVAVRGPQVLSQAERIRYAGVNSDIEINGTVQLRTRSEGFGVDVTYDPFRVCCITSAINTPQIGLISQPESDDTGCRFLLLNHTNANVTLVHSSSGPSSILCPGGVNYTLAPRQGVWLAYIANAVNVFWNVEAPVQGGSSIPNWVDVAFNAGDYTGGGSMTVTAQSADVRTHRYKLIGSDMMLLMMDVEDLTLGGTANAELRVAIPGGITPNKGTSVPAFVRSNNAGAFGVAEVQSGVGYIRIFRNATLSDTWPNSTNNNDFRFQIAISY